MVNGNNCYDTFSRKNHPYYSHNSNSLLQVYSRLHDLNFQKACYVQFSIIFFRVSFWINLFVRELYFYNISNLLILGVHLSVIDVHHLFQKKFQAWCRLKISTENAGRREIRVRTGDEPTWTFESNFRTERRRTWRIRAARHQRTTACTPWNRHRLRTAFQ